MVDRASGNRLADRAFESPTDADLVRSVLAGRSDAYALLVKRHQGALYRHARAVGLDRDTAEDMVQEALVRAYERLDRCRNPERFGLWLGRILRNRCLDHLKSPSTRRSTALSDRLRAPDDDPHQQLQMGSIGEALAAALESLPPEQREVFLLKHVESRSYEEISEMVGASVSALKMRVHRAREFLREKAELAALVQEM